MVHGQINNAVPVVQIGIEPGSVNSVIFVADNIFLINAIIAEDIIN